jgi:hypothetical protein
MNIVNENANRYEWGNADDEEEDEENFGFAANEQLLAVLQNDPTLDFFDLDFEFGDCVAIRLGAALKRNVHLQWITILVRPELTVRGAAALANGIHHSHIWRMDLNAEARVNAEVTRIIFLAALKTIKCLSLGFLLSDVDAICMGEAMQGNRTLQNLRVLVHELTIVGAQVLATGISDSQIAYLQLEGDSRKDSSEVIAILLRQGVMLSPTIKHLSVGSEGCVLDAAWLTSLQSLAIESKFDLPTLCNGLSQISITELKLRSCGLGNDDMRLLSSGLRNNTSVTVLCLQHNHIGDDGISFFVENWSRTSPIKLIGFGLNEIGSHGASLFLRESVHHASFAQVRFDDNKQIGFDGLSRIGLELPLICLSEIYLRGCAEWIDYGNVESEEAKAQQDLRYKASKAILSGVQDNVLIQLLRIENLLFMEEIQFFVEMNKRGRHLTRNDNAVPPALWCYIMAKHPLDCSHIFCFLREQPTLVSVNRNGNSSIQR